MLQNNKLIMNCSKKSIELIEAVKPTCVMCLIFHGIVIIQFIWLSVRLMASKITPKKLYKKSSASNENSSRCRLCNGLQDPRHCKNLFNKKNQRILNNVESIHGEKLPHVNGFPNLLCRPYERRVNNTITFKNVISETQKSLLKDSRTKRCLDISLSVAIPAAKVAVVDSRRRSLFNVSTSSDEPTAMAQMALAMPIEVSYYL